MAEDAPERDGGVSVGRLPRRGPRSSLKLLLILDVEPSERSPDVKKGE